MKIDPKITCKTCRKFYNFYFYVTNVFFDAGDHRECMEMFVGPIDAGNRQKSRCISPNPLQ